MRETALDHVSRHGLRASMAVVVVALAFSGTSASALAAPLCEVSVPQSWFLAPATVHVTVTSSADSIKGGPVTLWLDIDYKHAGTTPKPVAVGTAQGASYVADVRLESVGVHHLQAICGSGTGNAYATTNFVLISPLALTIVIIALALLLVAGISRLSPRSHLGR